MVNYRDKYLKLNIGCQGIMFASLSSSPFDQDADYVLECAMACDQTTGCTHWTLQRTDNLCYLLDSFNIGTGRETNMYGKYKERYTSGNKQCAHGRAGKYVN